MGLVQKLSDDITAAMRSKDQSRLKPLRMAKAAMMNREVEKGRPLEDGEAQQVLAQQIKQRRDSIEQYTTGGREELAASERAEILVLEAYLPPPVDPATIERAVEEAITETGATGAKDLGKVMKAVMPKLAGRSADGKAINELVRRKLET
ncbi:MAG: GatB/YqeY domain-containing protein [Acidobacteria bacterium]|nr:GatB/YqeY domain-containing protein [Acidobacteriota bacterium]